MKIEHNPLSETPPSTTSFTIRQTSSAIDTCITMGKPKFSMKTMAFGLWARLESLGKTMLEWTWWIVRLCPSENTRIEVVEEIIDHPTNTDAYKEDPVEFLGELIAAALIDPTTVDTMRTKNREEVGRFVRKFKDSVPKHRTILSGENHMLKKISAFLSFQAMEEDNPFLTFFLESPELIAGALKTYCKGALDLFGDKEGEGIQDIRIALGYLQRLATAHKDQPRHFDSFVRNTLSRTSFDAEAICDNASRTFDDTLKPTDEEIAAFYNCGAKNHLVLYRLIQNPKLLHDSFKGLQFGYPTLYRALFKQLKPKDFGALAKLMEDDYPLAAEVCHQLEDIAHYPGQIDKVRRNLPQAYKVLNSMLDDFKAPPAREED